MFNITPSLKDIKANHARLYSDLPVIQDPEGKQHICIAVVRDQFISPPMTWYILGVVSEQEVDSNDKNCVFFGYKETSDPNSGRYSTFHYETIILDAELIVDPVNVERYCPPKNWIIVK